MPCAKWGWEGEDTKEKKTKFLLSGSLQSNREVNQGLPCSVLVMVVDVSKSRHYVSTEEGF